MNGSFSDGRYPSGNTIISGALGLGRLGSTLGTDCFLAAALPSTALPRLCRAPFTRPFILALACDLGPADLADATRSFLPIHASRTARLFVFGAPVAIRCSSGPVFN